MTDRRDLLTRAASLLSRATDDAHDDESAPSREQRAAVVASMEAALRARAARRRRRTWIGRCAVAAAVVLGVVGGARLWSSLHRAPTTTIASTPSVPSIVATGRGSATALHQGAVVPFDGARLASGDRVVTVDAPAEVVLSTGTNLTLTPAADMTLAEMNALQEFDLGGGSVRARVAKLKDGERFLVKTRDAEIEVRGTVFEVSIVSPDASCGNGTPTRVNVTEGVVVVRANGIESRVAAGEVWPTGCVSPAPTLAPAPGPAPAPAPAPASKVSGVSDTLSAQNDLFASALAAERKGNLSTALSGFEAYLAKYPSGNLAESASAQKMSILSRIDMQRAAVAAHDYLARWPKGFARKDAEAILSHAP